MPSMSNLEMRLSRSGHGCRFREHVRTEIHRNVLRKAKTRGDAVAGPDDERAFEQPHLNHKLGTTESSAEIFRKITLGEGTDRVGEQRGTESERVFTRREETENGQGRGVFRAVGRGWTMDGDARVRGGDCVYSRFALDAGVSFGFVFRNTSYIWRRETTH